MMAESKAGSSSLPPFSRAGFGEGNRNFIDNHSASGARGGRDSIDITKSHFGDSALSGFYKQKQTPGRKSSSKEINRPTPSSRREQQIP